MARTAKVKEDPGILRWELVGEEYVPTYRAGMVPASEGLATRRQLRAEGLSIRGLKPAAWLHYSPLHGQCPLYLREQAQPVRVLTPEQYANLAAGRKLRGTQVCVRCQDARSLYRRQLCGPCLAIARAEAEERRKAEEAAYWQQFDEDKEAAALWAAEVLSDAGAVVFDTETTGLDGYVVEAAVVKVTTREVLFRTRLNPLVPIERGAQNVHGISDADVANERTFEQVRGELMTILRGASRVVIYNRAFDMNVLHRELIRLYVGEEPPYPNGTETLSWGDWSQEYDRVVREVTGPELGKVRAQCAMERYAEWFGAWSDYHGSYTWQPLGGGHDAVSDCLTVITRLEEMAATAPASTVPGPREGA